MALALLREDQVQGVVQDLNADQLHMDEDMATFLREYFIPTWSERFPPHLWNVYGRDTRTNNAVEGIFHELVVLKCSHMLCFIVRVPQSHQSPS